MPPASGPSGAGKTPLRASTAATLADLGVLYGGRGRLLRVAEVAEHLGVCIATVYRLCESGGLPHVRIINSIRVRPADLAAFVDVKPASECREELDPGGIISQFLTEKSD